MKHLLLSVLLAVSALASEDLPDGTDWGHMKRADKISWARGWVDGMNTGTAYAGKSDLVNKFSGMSIEEITKGMDQLYAADYRNTPILMGSAAFIVAQYSRGGLDSTEAIAMIQKMRDASHP